MRSKIDLQASSGGGVICTLKPLPQAARDITKSVQRGTFTHVEGNLLQMKTTKLVFF